MSNIDRIKEVVHSSKMSVKRFGEHIGLKTPQVLYDVLKGRNGISKDLASKIASKYPHYNTAWLLTGTSATLPPATNQNQFIPLFKSTSASNLSLDDQPDEFISTHEWLHEATATMRHFCESMKEYPTGCVLAIKEVTREMDSIVWGQHYVIETNTFRIARCIQRGNREGYIRAYSSNTETHPDGRLIHEPLDILWSQIRRISLVLGFGMRSGGDVTVYRK